ncbi:MAG TPA: hypothetical protein VFZ65_08785 [Planctomycetota bacterium]|nr:hypothetical protein [Planctomycetota bacterium]
MNTLANRGAMPARPRRSSPLLAILFSCAPLAAQQWDIKPAPVPDPVKGWHDMSPMAPAEIAARNRPLEGARAGDVARIAAGIAALGWQPPRTVLFDRPGDGRLWAATPKYKASFGVEGFVYVPFFGSQAPRPFPVHFVLRAVRVGGEPLALGVAEAVQNERRVSFDRGAVREVYDLGVDEVEQTFVVDSTIAGDVDIDVDAVTELAADTTYDGIRFGNEFGHVVYEQAWVRAGGGRHAVSTARDGNHLHIRVPASLRGDGPLIVDPIIHHSIDQLGIFPYAFGQPDIAYDATYDRFLVAWHVVHSASDYDVYSDMFAGNGALLPNALQALDVSTTSHANPRVADLAAVDQFLVVMQRFEAGRWQIYGRKRLASLMPVATTTFAISDPTTVGDCVNPDIGGDPSASPAANSWLVVWERQLSASDSDIHGRIVRSDIGPSGSTILIQNSSGTIHSRPSVSQSNGNGLATAARWLVVYQFRFSATDEDVFGAALAQNGTITTSNIAIDTSSASDKVPTVSSPNTTAAGGDPLFLVTYQRQNSLIAPDAARARLLSGSLVNQIAPVDLSAAFGLGPFSVSAECDGTRFAVINGTATGIGVATLAYTGSSLVLHEATQPFTGSPQSPRLCSKRSGGGTANDYGIVYVDPTGAPVSGSIGVDLYEGRQPGSGATSRPLACSGLGLTWTGRPYLGESMTMTLGNVGADIPGFAFGNTVPASPAFCASCLLGYDPASQILSLGTTLTIAIPPIASLVGYVATVQGFALGSGPCLLSLRFSDTCDFIVR